MSILSGTTGDEYTVVQTLVLDKIPRHSMAQNILWSQPVILVMVSYDILGIVCMNLLFVTMYLSMYDVRHDNQIPCTRYLAINHILSLSNSSV